MSPSEWLRIVAAVLEVVPALRSALWGVFSGDDASVEAQRVRDILSEVSQSELAGNEIRRKNR